MMVEEQEKTAQPEIMVVDDTLDNLRLLSRILTSSGYRVRPASHGRLALQSVAAKPPDLILLDVKMPEMDGLEVCRRLKAASQSRDIPVLFITGMTEAGDKVKGFAAGGLDYIAKPFNEEEVLARVGIHLRLHELTRRLEEKIGELSESNIRMAEEIAQRKRAEDALRDSEKQVRRKLDLLLSPEADISALELADIIDSEKIQKLMDSFYKLTNIGMGIIDIHGKVLVGTGWQEICTKFHRVNPETCSLCLESDLELSRDVPAGTFKLYHCKNNMWDIATPIMLGDRHVGNLFLGQFLFEDEMPDYETFRRQARRYGFNEQEYMTALDKVPRWSREKVDAAMSFYTAFAEMTGNLSYSNVKLASVLEDRKRVEVELVRVNKEFVQKNKDLELLLKSFAGRELRMIELKEQIKRLEKGE